MRTLDDILPQLSGAKYFTKLDARSGYWAIKLSRDSSYLTTFNTPYGRYRFLRLPFGLKSSQDEFQRQIDESFEGLSGIVSICDDILVFGRTRDEHDTNLRNILKRSLEKGIRLNEEKLEVGVTEVQYFGHILSAEGLKPDPAKVAAVREMEPPRDRAELETILGMVNYLSKFAPNLAEVTSPLRQLLAKDVEFSWDSPQIDAFQKVKDIITISPGPVLSYFDPKKPLTLQVDASKYGLGAALMQDDKPVAYASKSLTTTEINYAQIEKEMFAILFGCKRFHQYVYARKVHVQTDHLPLVSIMKKPLYAAPPRLQRMLLQLQRYDLEVKHYQGKNIPVADTLSRKFLSDTYPILSDGIDMQVHMVLSALPVSDRKKEEIQSLTEQDPQLVILKQVIIEGWPEKRSSCQSEIIDYWNYRDTLSVVDGLILKGHKIVIPQALRQKMLETVHSGHLGIEKCLKRARDVLFWPRISADISDLVSKCSICLERRSSNQKEPLITHDVPEYPWQKVATDLFTWDNKEYIVVVDYFSRYFEVKALVSSKSCTVINHMKSIFARFGIPEVVVSDNQTCYSSREFASFAKEWDFKHVTTSPTYPQSNGLAEKTVQTVKRILSKAKADGREPLIGILEYRATALDIGFSPAELLMGRQLRSILPTTREKLIPKTPITAEVKKKITLRKKKTKNYCDKSAQPLKPLKEGESARVQLKGQKWEPAVVIRKHNERSYTVRTKDGTIYRRNRRQLMKTNETHPLQCNINAPFSQIENTLCTVVSLPANASKSISESMESQCFS